MIAEVTFFRAINGERHVIPNVALMVQRISSTLLAFITLTIVAAAQPAPLRIATYNLLNYPGSTGAARNAAFRTIVSAMKPHVLVAQEIVSAMGTELFETDVLDRVFDGRFEAAPYVDASTDSEGAFYYDTTRVTYLGTSIVNTSLRAIQGYRFAVIGTTDTVWIYTVHLKADDGPDEAAQRAEEARLLRSHLDSAHAGQHVIVAGDFNTYNGTEPALARLIGEEGNAAARLIDPLANTGDWHSNRDFAFIHTQSPRVRSFGGGSTGGLDDRFDMMLISQSLSPVISRVSYTSFGNDVQHFNDSINRSPNSAVGDNVAQALHDASDHLPVYADFKFGVASVVSERSTLKVRAVPNPAADFVTFTVEGSIARNSVLIYNIEGKAVARVSLNGRMEGRWDCSRMPAGIYTWSIETRREGAPGTTVLGTVVITR